MVAVQSANCAPVVEAFEKGLAAIEAAFARYGALGVNAGLESAATLAALDALRASGGVRAGERVLLLNTGTQLIPLLKSAKRNS